MLGKARDYLHLKEEQQAVSGDRHRHCCPSQLASFHPTGNSLVDLSMASSHHIRASSAFTGGGGGDGDGDGDFGGSATLTTMHILTALQS